MMEDITEFMSENPHYGYLIGAIGFGIYLLGLILDWNWTLEPGGGYFNVAYFSEKLGRTTVRIILGIIMSIGIMAILGLFFYSNSSE